MLGLDQRGLRVAERRIGVRQQHLRIDVSGIALQDGSRSILRVLRLPCRQHDLREVGLRRPMRGLKRNRALQLLNRAGPIALLFEALCQSEMRVGKLRIDFQGAAIRNDRFGILLLLERNLASVEEFLLLRRRTGKASGQGRR